MNACSPHPPTDAFTRRGLVAGSLQPDRRAALAVATLSYHSPFIFFRDAGRAPQEARFTPASSAGRGARGRLSVKTLPFPTSLVSLM
jgi:hypothetical protein